MFCKAYHKSKVERHRCYSILLFTAKAYISLKYDNTFKKISNHFNVFMHIISSSVNQDIGALVTSRQTSIAAAGPHSAIGRTPDS